MTNSAVRGVPALFLDRDGVVNEDRGYVHRIEDVAFVPGIFELVRQVVQELGWRVVVTTNQSGIGRGYFDEAAYRALTDWICMRFRAENAALAAVYHCPFHPEHGIGAYRADHDWRKPKPGMILQAAADLDLDLARSAAIGDKMSDMQAAQAAGIALRILLDLHGRLPDPVAPSHHVIRSLPEAWPLLC
ncbi:MAG: D-glycero-alpha-D-manno-heptose-1,7-bisphosphate 7-phosphatase [Xanthobacteraceae bacterium]